MTRVVIALDSFKGCLSSPDACRAAANGVRQVDANASVKMLPLSDGGEGLTEVLTQAMGGHLVQVKVHGPLMEPLEASYGLIEAPDATVGPTAIIEMAATCGLPLVPLAQRDPERTTTYGFGEMIADALSRGCKRLILGIGGSATNDAGLGMLQALGARIELREGTEGLKVLKPTPDEAITGGLLAHVVDIDASPIHYIYNNVSILVACDVQNPLCGPQGAAYVFAPQKGADTEVVQRLDQGLRNILNIAHVAKSQPGDGAAGGLGFTLRHFLKAELQPGIELVLQQYDFDTLIADADIIITGEGKSDAQTLMGKVPMGVLRHALRQGRTVHLIAGMIEDEQLLLNNGFASVNNINNGDDSLLNELMQPEHAERNIKKTVAGIMEKNLSEDFS